MSKLRSLSTAFWSDPFIEECSVSEKLLFIYLITNEKTNMLGIYESSIKKIAFETGINKPEVQKALERFQKVGKVKYCDNYVVLVNYLKHQHFNTNMKKSALEVYLNLPESLQIEGFTVDRNNPLKAFETLSNHYGMVRKIEVEIEDEEEKETKEERKASFFKTLLPFQGEYSNQMLTEFGNYWTQINANGKKYRFEKEKTWDLAARLRTWNKNQSQWSKGRDNSNMVQISDLLKGI